MVVIKLHPPDMHGLLLFDSDPVNWPAVLSR